MLVFVACLFGSARLAQAQFPASGNVLWYDAPGGSWSREWLPIANGPLAGMVQGGAAKDVVDLNIESLWSGGPFQNKTYSGTNPPRSSASSIAASLANIRKAIFSNGTVDSVSSLDPLTYTDAGYGSFAGAGQLVVSKAVLSTTPQYKRWLDMDAAVVRSSWVEGKALITREAFCSSPAQACAYHVSTNATGLDAPVKIAFVATEGLSPSPVFACLDQSTLSLRGTAGDPGMTYELIARVTAPKGTVTCNPTTAAANASITVSGSPSNVYILWTGGTNYNIDANDAAHGYSFAGPDPHDSLLSILKKTTISSPSNFASLLSAHQADWKALTGRFKLNLGQKPDLSKTTAQLVSEYKSTSPSVGNPYIEWLAFNLGRYLTAASARGVLPGNLQGKWSQGSGAAWSGDYHANINVQQVYWSTEVTDLDVTASLWNYMEKTWVPRGTETAQILYNTTKGWVTHNEMNIFGATGMKGPNSASWADYTASAAWMMFHVWDHYDYGLGSAAWWKSQGYPLMKGHTQFWLQNLFADGYFKDGTYVTNPCNSPEQSTVTFGCAHTQQVVWQMFNAILKGSDAAGEKDETFLNEVRLKRSQMDQGLRIGRWGQLQEWKLDLDSPTDLHRHLSHLVGLYPGYAISSYKYSPETSLSPLNYSRNAILNAAQTSLVARGDGTGPDGDAGWEKVWRAACYAQLGNADKFYYELNYAVKRNFGANLFSLYNPDAEDPIYQQDANGAYPAVVLNALIQAPDVADLTTPLRVTVLPALPSAWATGSVTDARLRGGIRADIEWKGGKLTKVKLYVDRSGGVKRSVIVIYGGKTVGTFKGTLGASWTYSP